MQNNYVKIKDIADMAITEEQGFKLRAENTHTIVLLKMQNTVFLTPL